MHVTLRGLDKTTGSLTFRGVRPITASQLAAVIAHRGFVGVFDVPPLYLLLVERAGVVFEVFLRTSQVDCRVFRFSMKEGR